MAGHWKSAISSQHEALLTFQSVLALAWRWGFPTGVGEQGVGWGGVGVKGWAPRLPHNQSPLPASFWDNNELGTHALPLQCKGLQGIAYSPLFHPPAVWLPNSSHQLTGMLRTMDLL